MWTAEIKFHLKENDDALELAMICPEKMTKKSDTSIEHSPWGVPHKMNISKHKYLYSTPDSQKEFIEIVEVI